MEDRGTVWGAKQWELRLGWGQNEGFRRKRGIWEDLTDDPASKTEPVLEGREQAIALAQ